MIGCECLVGTQRSGVSHSTLDCKIFSLVIIEGELFSSGDSVHLSW